MTAGQFVQFTLQLGCDRKNGGRSKQTSVISSKEEPSDRKTKHARTHGLLVQYSTDGSITWSLLKVKEKQRKKERVFSY